MKFIGVTISDFSDKYKELATKSILSFLKLHDTKLIVYVIGDAVCPVEHDNLEIIRLPETKYDTSGFKLSGGRYENMINILISKLLCLTYHENFIFFENDVFFLKNVENLWDNFPDGISAVRSLPCAINTGLLFVKNIKLDYTLTDIHEYFNNNFVPYPCDYFISYLYRCVNNIRDGSCLLGLPHTYKKIIDRLDTCSVVHCVGICKSIENKRHIPEFITKLMEKLDTIIQ